MSFVPVRHNNAEAHRRLLAEGVNQLKTSVAAVTQGAVVEVEDEGVILSAGITKINFAGDGVTATNPSGEEILVTIPTSSGSAIEVEDAGSSLTTALTKLNFVGFTVSEPVANEITITAGSAMSETSSEYCPGYTFNYISTSQFSVVGLDVKALFRIGRRIKFVEGATLTYGVVTAIDYGSTTAGDTTITMTMESAATLQAGITDFCLTTSAVGWSPIASPPMAGSQMNDITAGYISTTKYWVIVGNTGKIAYSTNAGATWSDVVTTGTTEDITSVAYDHDNERFMAVTDVGGVLLSTDGTTWTYNTSLKATMNGGTGPVTKVQYRHLNIGMFTVWADGSLSGATFYHMTTADFSATAWATPASVTGPVTCHALDSSNLSAYSYLGVGSSLRLLDSEFDTASAVHNNTASTATAVFLFTPAGNRRVLYGTNTGIIHSDSPNLNRYQSNTTLFTSQINDFTFSIDHQRCLVVGDNATLGYLDYVDFETAGETQWVSVTTGFNPTSDIMAVHYDEDDNVFIACNSVGQIARSSNGTI